MSNPLDEPVYFLTWTTFGTWLPGDERGWVEERTSGPSEPIREPMTKLEEATRSRMTHDVVVLEHSHRALVHATIETVCGHRHWTLYAVNCRTNHVHVVLLASDRTPEVVMNSLKSWCSRRLNETLETKRQGPWWTRHGSTRWLNTVESFDAAVDYVSNRQ